MARVVAAVLLMMCPSGGSLLWAQALPGHDPTIVPVENLPVPDPPPPLNENCTASVQNRTVQVNPDGTFAIPNVPVDDGFYRVRIVCRQADGTTIGGQSQFFLLVPPDASTEIQKIAIGVLEPIPASIQVASPKTAFTTKGETAQLTVTGTLPDGSLRDLTTQASGTSYATSNAGIATVGIDGLVTVLSRGQAIITARNEGVIASMVLNVLIPNDADEDGLTDEYERANGFNPNDPTDAGQDPDSDGLSNLQEFQRGTNPRAADTDGDGLTDGNEITRGTDPLRADTDGDGLDDGQEIIRGSNPLNADTDGDGIPDGQEVQLGLNPLVRDTITTVAGRVVDNTGAPVTDASAVIFDRFTGTTDSTGVFSIPRVPAGSGAVTVLARIIRGGQLLDGTSASITPVAGGVTDVGTIQIGLNSGTVAGLVSDPQNRPVTGAQVTVAAGSDLRSTTTDATGRYRVANMVAGNLTVIANDPRTGLRGRVSGILPLNQSATVDVRLSPSGTVVGTVFGRDGVTPVGAGVTVSLSGSTFATSATDPLGRYLFDFVPLGNLTIQASDASGNRGRTSGNLLATGQTVVAPIAFLGRGTVTGVVQDAAGNAVPNASVDLGSGSVFGGSRSGTTDAAGRYSFPDIFVGPFNVSARAPIARLGGQAGGSVERDGQSVTTNVTLVASGTVTGTVFRAGGAVSVAGAQVSLSPTGLSTTADSQGRYRFDFIPLGSYTIDVTDPPTGDRGRGTGVISTQDELRTVDINLNGQGRVVVTVRDGGNALVVGAQATLDSQTFFGGRQSGVTQSDGTVTFERVLAGNFSVSAFDPNSRLSGSTTGSVAVAGTANVTAQLQSAGNIVGTVFGPNGTTPVSNISVRLSGPVSRQGSSAADGRFRFDIVPTGSYTLEAFDGGGGLRARVTSVVLGAHGQEVVQNLSLIGVGTVTGRVINPDGTSAAGIGVSLSSRAPGFGRSFFARSDVNGIYSISLVPVGPFSMTASGRTAQEQLFGATEGRIAFDGERVTADLQLSASLIPVTTTLYDANNFAYNLRENGSIQDGTTGLFGGDFGENRGGFLLDIVTNGVPNRFAGRAIGSTEEAGREIVIQQSALAGLDVTRKVFVPRTGYFARYLEILSNPTGSEVTVDLRVISHFRFMRKVQGGFTFDREPRIISTSSGDAFLDIGDPANRDRWIVIDDDDDGDPFLINTLPAAAHLFDGPGAGRQASQAGYQIDFSGLFGRLTQEWRGVAIPPGGTVAFMHFGVEQTGRAAAQASVERLIQLPPEALNGLSPEEIGQIQNFAVPTDGSSPLAPLPSLEGTVNGRMLAGDAATAVPNTRITLRSDHPLFGRTHALFANASGAYTFASTFNNTGGSVAIPIAPFTLQAVHPLTGIQAPATTGGFPTGLLLATQDVVFSNTGIVSGVVRRASGVVASAGTVQISGGALLGPVTVNIASDGSYRLTGIPAGSYTLVATLPHPQGTALTAATATLVAEGQSHTANLTVPPTGTVTGTVRRGSGEAVINLAVQLRQANLARSTTTDTGGRFTFFDIPTGNATLETFDPASNTAASEPVTVAADQIIVQDLTLSVGGTVSGLVTLPNNQPVSGVQIRLIAANGTFNATTGSDGRYRIDRVAPGNVTVEATDPVSLLRGRNSGSLGLSGQTIILDVRLSASGTVTGTVFRSDGTTPAPGVQLSLFGSLGFARTTTADALGRYLFDLVPLGSFTLDVTDPATGDRGRATNQINANGETRTVNVTLNGVGRVVVTVQNAGNNLIANASVTLTSQTVFGGSQSRTTQSDGTAIFDRVLAGNFFVFATDPITQLGGSSSGTVASGGTTNVTVQLQSAGTILGRVFAPDGTTAAANTTVRLLSAFFGTLRQTTSAGDGSFRFDAVPLGSYGLDALDGGGRLRTRESGITLSANGEVATRNLTFIGLGSVDGVVRNPDGTPAPSIGVSLRSANPVIGGFFNAVTGADGRYIVTDVPVGRFTATASDPARQLLGETSGLIDRDGQRVTADIQLLNNAINLPVTRYDANNSLFDIQTGGSILSGTNTVYGGDFGSNRGGFFLDVISGGVPVRFTGGSIGTVEENGREIVIRQQNVAGLDITRKVFVPQTGYFTRYLEIVGNPTADPITVDLRLQSNIRTFNGPPRVIATSSGDNLLDVSDAANPDRWVVIDDGTDGDPFLVFTLPAVAFGFDGPNALERAGSTAFTSLGAGAGQITYRWNNVTIPPGGTVAYLHFGVQQTGRAAAQASVERLIQGPPEALAGLSLEEIGQIRNFAIPADGISSIAPLPELNGAVNGRLLAGDGITPVSFAQVRFRSNSIFFGRTQFVSSDGNGLFSLNSRFNDFGSSIAVPIDGFTLQAFHPLTGIASPETFGNFPVGQSTAIRDIVFGNTGVVQGIVRRHTGAAVSGGTVRIQGGSPFINTFVNIADTGAYFISGVPAGTFTLTAFVTHPQGSALTGSISASVTAGQTTLADIAIPPTGAVDGTIRSAAGNPTPNTFVQLFNGTVSRSTTTNGSGQFTFPDVPVGTLTLRAFEPNTSVASTAQINVVQDQTTTQDLTLIGLGTVEVQVNFSGGTPAPSAQVNIFEEARGFFRFAGFTDSAGRLTIANVSVGAFTLRAIHPSNTSLFTDEAGSVVNHGDVVSATVVLPGIGTVIGRVTFADGTAAPNAFVQLFGSEVPSQSAQTDSNGNYTVANVPVGRPFTVRAFHPTDATFFREVANQTLSADGDTLTVDLTLPALAAVRVTVLRADNTAFAGARIEIQDNFRTFFRFVGLAGPDGVLTIANVPEGDFIVRARDPNTFAFAGSATGTVRPTDHGQTIDVVITAPLSGNVQGSVFAADGQTPLRFAFVEILDRATGQTLATRSTDSAGFYQANGVLPGNEGFRVRAHAPTDFSLTAEQTGAFTTTGETVTVDLTLPVSVLRGTVYFSDGSTPVPFPGLFATQTDPFGNTQTFFANTTNADGSYSLVGLSIGEFTVSAQDFASGLSGTATGTVTDLAVPVSLDVLLQPSGTVTGTVFDANNNVVPFANVALRSSGIFFDRFTTTDALGVYRFEHVALGPFALQAMDPDTGVVGSTTGTLTSDGETATVDLVLPETGTVSGTVFGVNGSTPVPQADITIENFAHSGPLGHFEVFINADASGNYQAAGIPVGTVRVTASDPSNFALAGFSEGVLTAGGTAILQVTLGNIARFTYNLDGTDGFRYDVDCDGELDDGGTTDRRLNDAYDGAYFLLVNGQFFPCFNSGRLEENGREIVIGPAALEGLDVTRKIFVPSGGGFARYLEILSNSTGAAITVPVEVQSNLGSDSRTRIVVAPSTTDNSYAVTDQNGNCCDPALAHVFGGPGAPLAASVTHFVSGDDDIFYRWDLTVPAGQTVILMHFAVQRDFLPDASAAQNQAASLASLTDPGGLTGMSSQERAQVVNFSIP